jgi:amidohydrolase
MRDVFDGITRSAHASFELKFHETYPVTRNDAALTERLVPTLVRLFGKDKVRSVPPETGAEDFSFFANVVPGFYFKVGVVPAGKASGGHHTSTFYADDQAVPIAMRALATLALDYLAAGR